MRRTLGGITLLDHQDRTVDAVLHGAYHEKFRKQLIVMPTGSGKTVVFAFLAQRVAEKGGKTLFLVHRDELVDQAVKTLAKITGLPIDVEKGQRHASKNAPIVVASIQSLQGKRLESWDRDHFKFIIPDEAHHSLADTWQRTLNHFDRIAHVVGGTATPDRHDKKNLGSYYENIAIEIGLLDLIEAGVLADIHVQAVPIKINLNGVSSRVGGDFDADETSHILSPILDDLTLEIVKTLHKENRKRVLSFLPMIDISKEYARKMTEAGFETFHVDGKSPDRKELLEKFHSGEIKSLSCSDLLIEGYDNPAIDCIIPLKPTRSTTRFSQQVGRGTRIYLSKDHLLLLDFLWQHEKHQIVRPPYLLDSCPEIQREMLKAASDTSRPHNLREIRQSALKASEIILANNLFNNKARKNKSFSIKELSLLLHDPEIRGYEPTMKWHSEPATEKQLATLENMEKFSGIDTSHITTKGEASFLIGTMEARWKKELASPKQILFLNSKGTKNPHLLTKSQASAILDGVAKPNEFFQEKTEKKPKPKKRSSFEKLYTNTSSPDLDMS